MLKKGLNGFQIKLFALIFMTMDHIRYAFVDVQDVLLVFGILGRIAAPLFIFMVTEGMRYTRSREKYLLRLWIGSVFMGIANQFISAKFPLASGGILIANIFSTLFIICLLIYGAGKIKEHYKTKQVGKVIGYTLLTLLPFISSGMLLLLLGAIGGNNTMLWLMRTIMLTIPSIVFTEGSFVFVFLGIGFYLFGKSKLKTSIFYLVLSIAILVMNGVGIPTETSLLAGNIQWLMVLALPFLLWYNHKKGKSMKYFFYMYYPLHLYALIIISYFVSK